jgi:hypothetical protein
MLGGTLMAALFLVYTRLHGPTSFYEQGRWLGVEGQVWGGLMNGVPTLLIATGIFGARELLTAHAGRAVRIGYLIALVALVLPALVDLAIRALSPPLLMPLQGLGLLLMALGARQVVGLRPLTKGALVAIGGILMLAFALALIPTDISDGYEGYRISGGLAYFAAGIGWLVLGVSLVRTVQRRHSPP